jgi:hypothetical protein
MIVLGCVNFVFVTDSCQTLAGWFSCNSVTSVLVATIATLQIMLFNIPFFWTSCWTRVKRAVSRENRAADSNIEREFLDSCVVVH